MVLRVPRLEPLPLLRAVRLIRGCLEEIRGVERPRAELTLRLREGDGLKLLAERDERLARLPRLMEAERRGDAARRLGLKERVDPTRPAERCPPPPREIDERLDREPPTRTLCAQALVVTTRRKNRLAATTILDLEYNIAEPLGSVIRHDVS